MVKFLGYENLMPKYNAYNVCVSFPFSGSRERDFSGVNVAVVYTKPDTFDRYFKDVKLGSDVALDVSFSYVPYKEPQNGTYKPHWSV